MTSEHKDFTSREIDEYREAFELFDRDADGVISAEELKFAMTGVGMTPSDEEVAEMIAEIDEDQSGSISFDEFVLMMKTRMDETDPEKEMKEAFNMFDLDKDGLIHWKELKVTLEKLGSVLTASEIHDMIMDADEDSDGAIDYEEFKKMMLCPKPVQKRPSTSTNEGRLNKSSIEPRATGGAKKENRPKKGSWSMFESRA